MAVYNYTGYDNAGRSAAGTIEAPSEQGALDRLSGEGIVPATLTATANDGAAPGAGSGAAGAREHESAPAAPAAGPARRVPMSVRMLFVRELTTFIKADVPLLEALGVLRRQEAHPAFRAILEDVYDRVRSGESFSHALAAHPRIFSSLLVNMVRVGETGGLLGSVLEQMATWMEHEDEVRGEVRGALAYPLMIVALGTVTVIILFSFVLPRITNVFASQDDLPFLTRTMMGVAGFMGHWWWLVLALAAVTGLAVRSLLRSPAGQAFYDRASLRAPLVGALVRKAAIARFARANAALLAAGVPLLDSLRVVRGLLGNAVLAAMIDAAIERVTRGQSLAHALEDNPWFPPGVVHLLGVGERTGTLAGMFERVAQTFERQTRGQIRVMLNLLSPLLIIALAVLVAIIAISILLPIFKLNSMMK